MLRPFPVYLCYNPTLEYSEQVQLVLDILKNETDGDVQAAIAKLTPDYKMTWMYEGKDGELFPSTHTNVEAELDDVYHIENRSYDVRNITEGADVVMIELIESYPDPKQNKYTELHKLLYSK